MGQARYLAFSDGDAMTGKLTPDEILSLLKLEPNATCGFVRLTFVSKQSVAAGVLPSPFAEARPLGSALYFMVTPGAPVRLHRIRNDQLYHYYLGDPLEVFMLHADGSTERVVVGPNLRSGFPAILFTPRAWPRMDNGSLAQALNGRASCLPTSRSATSTCLPTSTLSWPPICAPSPLRRKHSIRVTVVVKSDGMEIFAWRVR